MKRSNKLVLLFIVCVYLYIFGSHGYMTTAAESKAVKKDSIAVIVNKSVSEKSISENELRNIYLGKVTRWNDKTKIVILTLDDEAINDTFMREYVGRTPSQFKTYWKKKAFTGKGKVPKSFKTEKEMLDYISKNKGTIGYLSVTSAKEGKANILTIK